MKEDADVVQKRNKIKPEDCDPNKAMYPVQQEAFQLLMQIENRQYEAFDKIRRLEKAQKDLEF